MTTTPTSNPIPSESPRDLKFNAGKVDEFVNSTNSSYIDRFGIGHYTIEGLKKLVQNAIAAYGWIPLDSFQLGATLTMSNQILKDSVSGEYYRWDGAYPKVVPAGSTPSSTGGYGINAWLSVGDSVLRSQLAAETGYELVPSISRINSVVPVESFRTSGLNDQQVIQAANDYAASVGRALLFESGKTYTVTTVTATCSWKGKGKIKRVSGSTSDMVIVGNGGSLKDISIDGSADTLSTAANTVYVNSNSRFDLDGLIFTNTPGHTIVVQNTPLTFAPSRILNIKIEGGGTSSVQASAGAGLYLYNALNVHVSGNEITKKANGILCQGNKRNSARLSFTDNTIYKNYGGALGLVLMSEAADQQAYEKVIVTNNHCYDNGDTALAIQCDLSVVSNNIITGNGTQTYHQGVLVNANGVIVTSNTITGNGGVGIDFGDCRKCSATANHIEENGWIGIEVNSCEQVTVTGNVLNRNFRGKTGADLQAAILVHTGNGGYPFLGDTKNITISGNTVGSGDGQQYAILVADTNCYNVVVTGNNCKLVGLVDDIISRSSDVICRANNTRWDPMGASRATVASNAISIPSVADTVQVNGTGSVLSIKILNSGAFIKDRYVRIYSINGMTLENSGPSSTGNLFLGSSIVLSAGDSVRLWSDGSGGWKRA